MPKTDTPALILSLPGQRETLTEVAVTTADECKEECEVAIDGTTDKDWCCFAVAVADPASLTCSYFSILAAELDIRAAEEEAVEGTTNSAWACKPVFNLTTLPRRLSRRRMPRRMPRKTRKTTRRKMTRTCPSE